MRAVVWSGFGMWRSIGACGYVAAALLAGGCTVMSESECRSANWEVVGERDGREGREWSQLARYYDACSAVGVTPDPDEYRAGYDRGLESYCTPNRGYSEGRGGMSYHGVCPPGLEPDFLDAYQSGVTVGQAASHVQQVEYDIDDAKGRIEDLKREIDRPAKKDDSGEEKAMTAEEREAKSRELGRLEGKLRQLRDQRVQAQALYQIVAADARRKGYPEPFIF